MEHSLMSTPGRYEFFELNTPHRIVLKAPFAGVFELTPNGWRPASRLSARIRQHARRMTEEEVRRRCRQLLYCRDMPHTGQLPETNRMRSELRGLPHRIWDWVEPPLPYRAPVTCQAGTSDTAKIAFLEAVSASLDLNTLSHLVERARIGYERQEVRVQAIEARSGAFEGYATAVAGLVAVGAALLTGRGSPRPSEGWSGYFLLVLLMAAVWCLVVSGFRAYQAAVKRIDWPRPFESAEIISRARGGDGDAAVIRDELAALLLAEQRGDFLADWKLERLKQASRWFALALIALLVAALFLLATTPLQAPPNAST
jgi:hypothetical protein